jgi:hypothetical protein
MFLLTYLLQYNYMRDNGAVEGNRSDKAWGKIHCIPTASN